MLDKKLCSHQSLRIFSIKASEEATLVCKQGFTQQFKPLTAQTTPVYPWQNKRNEKQDVIRQGFGRNSPKFNL